MMKKRSLAEKVVLARKTKFEMSPEVSFQKVWLPEGYCAYVYRHKTLGELGRLVLLPNGHETQLSCEVVGDVDDPMTQKRRAILEPILKDVLDKMTVIAGQGDREIQPYTLQKQERVVKSEVYPCDICGKPVYMLVFAPDACTADRLEDYARLMYKQIQKLNVPTWIMGEETEVKNAKGEYFGEALILKVYPTREKAQIISSTKFNPILERLIKTHCA